MIRKCVERPAELINKESLIRKLPNRVFNGFWEDVITRDFVIVERQVIRNW
jgi:hypothetical protein